MRLKLNLQLFAEEDEHDEEDLDGEELEGEVITDEYEDGSNNGGGHHNRASRVGVHQALDKEYWEQYLELQKMQNAKVNHHLEALAAKLEDLDARHQAIPASVKAEIQSLFEAHKEAGLIDEKAEEGKKLSKYKRH